MKFKRSNGVVIEAMQFTRDPEKVKELCIFAGFSYDLCDFSIPRTPNGVASLMLKTPGVEKHFRLKEGDWFVKEGKESYTLPDSDIKQFYTVIRRGRKPKTDSAKK